jgi:REDY-like protein HapK
MPTMVVLVRLNAGVSPEDYERWVLESYAPTVLELPSVSDWRNHRVTNLLGSGERPLYDYVVTLEVTDLGRLGEDMGGDRMQKLLSGLHGYAATTQLMAERFV